MMSELEKSKFIENVERYIEYLEFVEQEYVRRNELYETIDSIQTARVATQK